MSNGEETLDRLWMLAQPSYPTLQEDRRLYIQGASFRHLFALLYVLLFAVCLPMTNSVFLYGLFLLCFQLSLLLLRLLPHRHVLKFLLQPQPTFDEHARQIQLVELHILSESPRWLLMKSCPMHNTKGEKWQQQTYDLFIYSY